MTPCIPCGQIYFKMFHLLGKHCIRKVVTYLLDLGEKNLHFPILLCHLLSWCILPQFWLHWHLGYWLLISWALKANDHLTIHNHKQKCYVCDHIIDSTQTTPTITHYHMKEPNTMEMFCFPLYSV